VVTGLRPGEKLTEELHTAEERDEPTTHPKIHQVRTPVPSAAAVQRTVHRLADALDHDDPVVVRQLLLPTRTDEVAPSRAGSPTATSASDPPDAEGTGRPPLPEEAGRDRRVT
jgi:FlaA1/EpsC-like NDP-sugar epimerase